MHGEEEESFERSRGGEEGGGGGGRHRFGYTDGGDGDCMFRVPSRGWKDMSWEGCSKSWSSEGEVPFDGGIPAKMWDVSDGGGAHTLAAALGGGPHPHLWLLGGRGKQRGHLIVIQELRASAYDCASGLGIP